MSEWKVFAEDGGTGLQSQEDSDYGDGANFAAHAHVPNATDFSVSDPTITVDFAVPEVTVSEAQYRVRATNVETRDREGETVTVWPEVTFAVKAPSAVIGLEPDTVNHVFVDVDLTTTGDDGQYTVNTTGTAPTEPSLKIAEVDTAAESVDPMNKHPDGNFGAVNADSASVTTAPSADTDVARKSEVDGKADQGDVDGIASSLSDHEGDTNDPHNVDYTQTGGAAADHDHSDGSINPNGLVLPVGIDMWVE